MNTLKQYVSAKVSRHVTDVDKPGVIIGLYGSRGGTVSTTELTLEEAASLRDQLSAVIAKMDASLEEMHHDRGRIPHRNGSLPL